MYFWYKFGQAEGLVSEGLVGGFELDGTGGGAVGWLGVHIAHHHLAPLVQDARPCSVYIVHLINKLNMMSVT